MQEESCLDDEVTSLSSFVNTGGSTESGAVFKMQVITFTSEDKVVGWFNDFLNTLQVFACSHALLCASSDPPQIPSKRGIFSVPSSIAR